MLPLLLQTLIETQGGLSTKARLVVRYEHLMLRPALAHFAREGDGFVAPTCLEQQLSEGRGRLVVARLAPAPRSRRRRPSCSPRR